MATNEGMKELITLINRLQDAAAMAGMNLGKLDLPQIAVIGEQSTGKSSVLENFVGRDFLPRGQGIVTRRPLVLQLYYNESEEYAEFLHLPERIFTDFLQVRKEIESETARTTSGSKGISSVPINLRIHSPNVLELTLVDLPGITQVPVVDQHPDIVNQIMGMVLEYISQENTLILTVSPASQDLANSNALKLAKSVDPEGLRTIGVVTKLDLMDKGTDAREILENKVLPLRRGYVGLVNRSQEDIDKGKDIKLAQEAEAKFFKTHDAYKHMADRMGTKFLQQLLNEQLCEHIRDKLPGIRANMNKQHQEAKNELEGLQAFSEVQSDTWKQTSIVKLLQEFSEDFRNFIDGHSVKADGSQLNAGARINHCIYDEIYTSLDQIRPPNERELKILIQNEHGWRNALFAGELSFDIVVREMVRRYSEPTAKSVELISDILSSAIVELSKKFVDYPRLKDAVQSLLADRLKKFEEATKKHLQIHLNVHAAFMNTKHPEFEKISDLSQLPQNEKQNKNTRISRSDSRRSKSTTLPEVLQNGWIGVVLPGPIEDSKWYWFVLTTETFTWFIHEEKDQISSVSLDGLRIVSNNQNETHDLGRIGKSLSPDVEKLTIIFRNKLEEKKWFEAFQNVGVEFQNIVNDDVFKETPETVQAGASDTPNSRKKLYEKVASDPQIQDDSDIMIHMVNSYIKILDRTIHDIVPKYIILLLVQETVEYTSKLLLADIMAEESWKDLLEVGPRELVRRERLLTLYKSTKEAMDIMNSVDVF